MTATCFILLAISGLNYSFGKRLLMPLIGPDSFSTWSQWAKYAHNFLSWPFMLGVLIMIAVWLRHNLPDRYDWPWLKAGGGLYNNRRPPAGHFNAGQKLVFRSEEHTSELQSLMRISYAVFCLKNKKQNYNIKT